MVYVNVSAQQHVWYGFQNKFSKTCGFNLLISDGYKHVCPFCGFERENYMHAMCGARGSILQYDSKFLYRDSGTLRMHGSLSCVGTMCCVLRAYGASAHARLMDATRSSRCYVWYSHASIHLAIQNASSLSVIARSTAQLPAQQMPDGVKHSCGQSSACRRRPNSSITRMNCSVATTAIHTTISSSSSNHCIAHAQHVLPQSVGSLYVMRSKPCLI